MYFTVRCEALKTQTEVSSGENLHKEIENMKSQYKILKVQKFNNWSYSMPFVLISFFTVGRA